MPKTTKQTNCIVQSIPLDLNVKVQKSKKSKPLASTKSKLVETLPYEICQSLDDVIELCIRGESKPEELLKAIEGYIREEDYELEAFEDYIREYVGLVSPQAEYSDKSKLNIADRVIAYLRAKTGHLQSAYQYY